MTTTELANEQLVSITTFKRDGTPVSTPVWVAGENGNLLVISGAVEKLLAQKYGWMYRAYTRFSALTRRLRRQAAPTGVTIRITPR